MLRGLNKYESNHEIHEFNFILEIIEKNPKNKNHEHILLKTSDLIKNFVFYWCNFAKNIN